MEYQFINVTAKPLTKVPKNEDIITIVSSDSDSSFDDIKFIKKDYRRKKRIKNQNNKDYYISVNGTRNYTVPRVSTLWSLEDDMELVDFALRNMKSSEPCLRFMKVTKTKIARIDDQLFDIN